MSSPNGGGSFWMPPQASTVAPDVDGLFDFILWLSVFFFVLILGLTVWFVVRYRRRSAEQPAEGQLEHSRKLEITWTLIPTVLIIAIFVWGFRVFLDQNMPPANAYEIQVRAEKWRWNFIYPDGTQTLNELHVPVGRPVKLVMSSTDVLHSFFVPAFRVKQDVIPNRYSTVWFEATTPGTQVIFCTEYCGTGHSDMVASVIAHPPEEFQKLLEAGFESGGEGRDPVAWGEDLFTKKTCNACHSVDGSPKVGPTMKGLFGKEEKLADGSTVKVDENYLRESMMDPNAKVVQGFAPAMPSFQGQLSDAQVDALIAYIKSLK